MKHPFSPPHGHSIVETLDGSFTLFSEAFDEACHSSAGAKSETVLHYVNGCQILSKLKIYSPLVILEVGFGLGVGLLTTLETIPPHSPLHFISVEIDKNLLLWFTKSHPEFKWEWRDNLLLGNIEDVKITIIYGDARITLPHFISENKLKWHAIYQDAFSPKKNSRLWTKEWFHFLKENSHPDVILSTYSASSSIRKSLHETGWGVQKGDKFGPKRSSTRAYLNLKTDSEILEQLNRSPVKAFTDSELTQNEK